MSYCSVDIKIIIIINKNPLRRHWLRRRWFHRFHSLCATSVTLAGSRWRRWLVVNRLKSEGREEENNNNNNTKYIYVYIYK